jgi:hypothetical protein
MFVQSEIEGVFGKGITWCKALVRGKKLKIPYDIMMILEISTRYQGTKRENKSWALKKWNANQNWCFIFQNALPFWKEKNPFDDVPSKYNRLKRSKSDT